MRARPPSRVGLGWAFFERQTNLWKRYWAWELVWLRLRGGQHPGHNVHRQRGGPYRDRATKAELARLTMFLLIGTLVWAYLSAILDDMSLTIMWERWEGTIEHTLMAPVPRVVHLIGMSAFGVMHALLRTILIMVCALPFFDVHLAGADWLTAAVVIVVGSVSLVGLGHPGRYPAAALPRARRTDVVHGPGAGPAGFRRLLQRRCLAWLVPGRVGILSGHLPAERDP